MKRFDLVGQTIGLSRVEEFVGTHPSGHSMWRTRCTNCGQVTVRMGNNVKRYLGCQNCNGRPQSESGLRRLFKSYSSRAAERGYSFGLTLDQFKLLTSLPCHYCGTEPQQVSGSRKKGQKSDWGNYRYNGLDRVNNEAGYENANCVPCCWMCNQTKGSKTSLEYTQWLDRVSAFRMSRIKPKIQVLVGMIASGKSTYCKKAVGKGSLIVNDDAIVNMLHGDDYTLYSQELKTLYKGVENHVIVSALLMGRNVIVDRGLNVSVSGRQRWISLARSFDVPVEAIVFKNDGPEAHATRRTGSDARGHDYAYWHRVATIHNNLWSPPTEAEGFTAIHTITFDEIKEGRVIA